MITDTQATIETPEGADLPLDPAGVLVRISAFLIDSLIKFGTILVLGFIYSLLGDFGWGMFFIIYFLIEWFYPVVFEVWRHGRTPGKKYMGLTVVNDDGTPVTFAASLIRNLLRVVDILPSFYVVGMVVGICNQRFKRVGDLAAGTLVVYSHKKAPMPVLDVKEKRSVPLDFTTDEQRALLNFAERSTSLSRERQQELALILAPIVGSEDVVNTLKKMANSTLGSK